MKYILFAICLYSIISLPTNNWGLLVAGSNGYWNYRHQSDVFHAYQILKSHGIPEDHIIVMAYDDIADDEENPFPGKVYNHPDPEPLEVYHDVKINYKDDDVTPENFLAILKGERGLVEGGDGRVIESTSEDNIFVYFSDHGSPNCISFPSKNLYANQLENAINVMYKAKKYNKMVFYIEACYSGSMFDGILLPGKNVYATTAANSDESSYATYCDEKVLGEDFDTCLGDEYSVSWLEDSDKIDFWETTLGQQKETVAKLTQLSHVMEYGELSIRDDLVGDFQGHKGTKWNKFLGYVSRDEEFNKKKWENRVRVPATHAKLYYLKHKAERSDNIIDQQNYLDEVEKYNRSYKIFKLFREKFDLDHQNYNEKVNYDCYQKSFEWYGKLCGYDVDRDFGFLKYLHHFCTLRRSTWEVYHAFHDICHNL